MEAYYQLALIYYEKAIIAQHDIQLHSYQTYYFKKAEECFKHVFSKCPGYAHGSLTYYLGEMYYYQHQYIEARDYFKQYLTLSNNENRGYTNAKNFADQCSQFLLWMDESLVKKAQPLLKINTPGDERSLQISTDGRLSGFCEIPTNESNSIYTEMADELFEAYLPASNRETFVYIKPGMHIFQSFGRIYLSGIFITINHKKRYANP
jgi:tetratricopeptide (TPR) repeat protein